MKNMLAVFALLLIGVTSAHADELGSRHDDRIMFDVSSEDWVSTKTARVTAMVEAAVTTNTAGAVRSEMSKTVQSLAKGEWRVTSFDRMQDQTGMERWSATYEARLPETDLSGLADTAKKLSKAGLQITIGGIDFSPTLEETEAVRAGLRTQIYKIASDQLTALNTALPGRGYRIALINFTGEDEAVPMPRVMKGRAAIMNMTAMTTSGPESASSNIASSMERAEKVTLSARIVFAASAGEKPAAPPAPVEIKH